MPLDVNLFWILIFAGAAFSGWWLTVQPGASVRRDGATPVALLLLILTVLLCMLALTGTSASKFAGGVSYTFSGT